MNLKQVKCRKQILINANSRSCQYFTNNNSNKDICIDRTASHLQPIKMKFLSTFDATDVAKAMTDKTLYRELDERRGITCDFLLVNFQSKNVSITVFMTI